MSGDEHPSATASHWRDANPPLFTKERLETSSGTSTSFDTATLLALDRLCAAWCREDLSSRMRRERSIDPTVRQAAY